MRRPSTLRRRPCRRNRKQPLPWRDRWPSRSLHARAPPRSRPTGTRRSMEHNSWSWHTAKEGRSWCRREHRAVQGPSSRHWPASRDRARRSSNRCPSRGLCLRRQARPSTCRSCNRCSSCWSAPVWRSRRTSSRSAPRGRSPPRRRPACPTRLHRPTQRLSRPRRPPRGPTRPRRPPRGPTRLRPRSEQSARRRRRSG